MKSAIQVQILDKPIYVSLCANALGKGMKPSLLPPAIGKIVRHIGQSTNLGEGTL